MCDPLSGFCSARLWLDCWLHYVVSLLSLIPSYTTNAVPCRASRSALAQPPVKNGRMIYEEQAPFFCRTKVDGPSPTPPDTPPPWFKSSLLPEERPAHLTRGRTGRGGAMPGPPWANPRAPLPAHTNTNLEQKKKSKNNRKLTNRMTDRDGAPGPVSLCPPAPSVLGRCFTFVYWQSQVRDILKGLQAISVFKTPPPVILLKRATSFLFNSRQTAPWGRIRESNAWFFWKTKTVAQILKCVKRERDINANNNLTHFFGVSSMAH